MNNTIILRIIHKNQNYVCQSTWDVLDNIRNSKGNEKQHLISQLVNSKNYVGIATDLVNARIRQIKKEINNKELISVGTPPEITIQYNQL